MVHLTIGISETVSLKKNSPVSLAITPMKAVQTVIKFRSVISVILVKSNDSRHLLYVFELTFELDLLRFQGPGNPRIHFHLHLSP